MENKKLFKVILGGVVSTFVLSGCHASDEEIKKTDSVVEEPSFLGHGKLERDKLIKELNTAKKVKVYAYNGEEVETFVNKDSEDLVLMIAYYDAVETKLYGNTVRNYGSEDAASTYYDLNYKAIMDVFNKEAGEHPSQVRLAEIYDSLLEKWNAWNLSYCTEEVQQEIALKMVERKNQKSSNYSFEYVNHAIKYEDCKYQDLVVKVPVYYFEMQSYKEGKDGLTKDKIVSVLPDVDLVNGAKKEYYQKQENKDHILGIYRRTGSHERERYILLKQYHDVVPGTNYEYIFFILQCQILKNGEWINYGQIIINQDLFTDFERIGEESFPLYNDENVDSSYQVNGATAYVTPTVSEAEFVQEEQTSYHM